MVLLGLRQWYQPLTRDAMTCTVATVPLTMTSAAPLLLDMTQWPRCALLGSPLLLRASDTMSISGCSMERMVPCTRLVLTEMLSE